MRKTWVFWIGYNNSEKRKEKGNDRKKKKGFSTSCEEGLGNWELFVC